MFYGVTDIKTFIIGTIFIVVLPGPNSMYIISTAARYGIGAGYRGAVGVFFGDLILMVLAATGFAAVVGSSPIFFMVIKWVGACYLVFIGINMLRFGYYIWIGKNIGVYKLSDIRHVSAFRGALVISLTNPKAILFYVSFFIQFVSPGYDFPELSFFVLGSIVQVCTFVYLSILIFCGSFLAKIFGRCRRFSAMATACIGGVFVNIGSKLALTDVS